MGSGRCLKEEGVGAIGLFIYYVWGIGKGGVEEKGLGSRRMGEGGEGGLKVKEKEKKKGSDGR